ncbi:MAG TPA: Mov34/MPN/PAD-1 family protein [Burkholderiales bacterium]|nr:Mov34/MPN/PAD-1 family protein [Burkholderiales bacterium]
MIQWCEQTTELPRAPLVHLTRRLAAADVESITAQCDRGRVVVVDAQAHADVAQHLATSRDEQGGLLIGQVFTRDADAIAAVFIRIGVAAPDFASSGVSLRMESGVWTRAQEALREGELVVGWYHSHPGLGAFFSATDRRTQRAFFAHSYSVGWVRDPLRREECWFVGGESEPVPDERVFILPPH